MPSSKPDAAQTNLVSRNWQRIRDAVAEACLLADRPPSQVRIVGVTKYVGPQLAQCLLAAGCQALGENRPQQLWEKQAWLTENSPTSTVEWHFIGHLQRNKVRRTLPMLAVLHSLDNLRLAETVSREAVLCGRSIKTLIDVNVTQDESKTGVPSAQLPSLVESVLELPGIQLSGLMAMSSLHAEPEDAQREFAQVRELRDAMAQEFSLQDSFTELSMGMSGDFREAIIEGATLVRIGSNLWEGILP